MYPLVEARNTKPGDIIFCANVECICGIVGRVVAINSNCVDIFIIDAARGTRKDEDYSFSMDDMVYIAPQQNVL